MDFLRLLESVRTPALSAFMSVITYGGDEIFFIMLAITIFWCVDKRDGYYVLLVGFLGTLCNQFLKLWFRIPRPWVLDPDFTIVESARAAAAGYSFPSGHTQNIVGTMACVILMTKNKKIRAVAVVLMLLVPFSRMYLGCHTPLDVSVSFVLALALAVGLRPVITAGGKRPACLWGLLFVSLTAAVAYWAFVTYYRFPADVDTENLHAGVKNAYTMLGCLAGMMIAKWLDDRFIRFRTDAVRWVQAAKTILGFALLMALRAGLKAPLRAILPEGPATAMRYCMIVFFAAAVWPLAFPWFRNLGRNSGSTGGTSATMGKEPRNEQ